MKQLVNITRLKGVETQIKRVADLLETLLIHQGVIVKESGKDTGGVGYSSDEETAKRELMTEIGKIIPGGEEEEGTVG